MAKNHLSSRSGLSIRTLLGLSICVLVAAGCAAPPQSRSLPPEGLASSPAIEYINSALASAALQTPAAAADYPLGPEDVLQITLFNIPEGEVGVTPRRTEMRVSQEGKIMEELTIGDVARRRQVASGWVAWRGRWRGRRGARRSSRPP